MSVQSSVAFDWLDHSRQLVEVADIQISLTYQELKYGSMTGGTMTLQGRLAKALWTRDRRSLMGCRPLRGMRPDQKVLITENIHADVCQADEETADGQSVSVWLLPVLELKDSWYGLILEERETQVSKFYRVGRFEYSRTGVLEEYLDDSERRDVTVY